MKYGAYVVEYPLEHYAEFDTLQQAWDYYAALQLNEGEFAYLFRDVTVGGYLDSMGLHYREV